MSQWCRTLVMIRISMFSVLFSCICLGGHHNFNINQVTFLYWTEVAFWSCYFVAFYLQPFIYNFLMFNSFFLTDLRLFLDRGGEFAFFWTTLISLGWGICILLTKVNFLGVRHLNWKDDRSSNPPPLPHLPASSLTLIGA